MSLTAAAADRKARLASLKSLKRKAGPDDDSSPITADTPSQPDTPSLPLSGRNYDPLLRAPKLGFESAPSASAETAEQRAASLAEQAALAAQEAAEKPVDLFSLRPKGANADLKRELERRMEESGLAGRTERAIAAIVRARIAGQTETQKQDGVELVEATREREKEDEEERRREKVLDEELVAV